MINKQDDQTQATAAVEPRGLTAEEILDVAGGPQVTNDSVSIISPEDVAAVAGGPQVVNDSPVG